MPDHESGTTPGEATALSAALRAPRSRVLPVAVGPDGSRERLVAAGWAAREAILSRAPLRLAHAWEQPPAGRATLAAGSVPLPDPARAARSLDETRDALTHRHPGLHTTADSLPGLPALTRMDTAADAEPLVLGARGLSRAAGLLLGSVSRTVLVRAGRPVVLVRPDPAGDVPAPAYGDVVVGVGLDGPDGAVMGFAFGAASVAPPRRGSCTAGARWPGRRGRRTPASTVARRNAPHTC
ncbi:universal stress protein [Streptomyces sp. NPDC014991]|uniref:universal stress protein n=1 Tax=Streptomyces sp. NPDC014991 TaxID=3364935 RepID=UPI0036FE975F